MYVCAADFMCVRVSGYCSRNLYVGHGGQKFVGFGIWFFFFFFFFKFVMCGLLWIDGLRNIVRDFFFSFF